MPRVRVVYACSGDAREGRATKVLLDSRKLPITNNAVDYLITSVECFAFTKRKFVHLGER